jgi:putative AlgH/UPF0301 family transcriptional regulator
MRRLFGFILLILASAAHAQPTGKPLLLVASPELQGPFAHSVVIAMPVGEEHLGFILNRPTGVKLTALFPEHAPSAKVVDPVYLGGPEMPNAVFAVVRRNPGAGAVRLLDDAFLVGDAEGVDRVIEGMPNDARYFAGFVGWRASELSEEIEAGYWHVAEVDAGLFWQHNDSLWEELIARLEALRA